MPSQSSTTILLISGARGAKDAGEQSPLAFLAVVVTVTSCGVGCCACVCAGEVAGASDVVAVVGSAELELELELELDCATASENWGSLGLAELSASSAQDTSAMLSGNATAQASVRERTDFRGIGMS